MASDSEIADTLTGRHGPVVIAYRYTWRDKLWNELGLITDAVRSSSVSFDSRQDVTKQLQMSLDLAKLGPEFAGQLAGATLPGRFVGVEAELLVGTETVTYPRGLYRLSSHARLNLGEGDNGTAEVVGLDPSVVLLEARGTPYSIPVGTNYVTAVTTILNLVGLTRFSITPSTAVFPANITYPPATPYLSIVNDILEGINYWPLWFSMDGTAYSTYRGNPETTTFDVDVVYSQDEPVFPIGEPFNRESDWERVPNEVTVTIETIERPPDGRTARNETTPPNGTQLLGEVINEKRVADTALDGAMLAELAVWYVVEARSLATIVRMRIQPDLRRDPTRALREIASLELDQWFEAAGSEPTRRWWHILSWTHDMSAPGQPMELTLGSLLPGQYVVGDPLGPSGDTVIYPL